MLLAVKNELFYVTIRTRIAIGSNEWMVVVKGKWLEDIEEETVECVEPLNGCVNPSNGSDAAQVILNVWDDV